MTSVTFVNSSEITMTTIRNGTIVTTVAVARSKEANDDDDDNDWK